MEGKWRSLESTLISVKSITVWGVSDNLKTIHSNRLRSQVLEASRAEGTVLLSWCSKWNPRESWEKRMGQVPPGNVKACWQKISLLKVSQNILYSDHVVPPDQYPRARSRLEGAKRRPRIESKGEAWVAEEAEESMSQAVLAQLWHFCWFYWTKWAP